MADNGYSRRTRGERMGGPLEKRKGATDMDMDKAKSTPTPWSIAGTGFTSGKPLQSIWGPTPEGKQSGEWIAKNVSPSNARLIVRAVNAHHELLEACKEFVRKCECGKAFSKHSYAQMKAAIAKATEGE